MNYYAICCQSKASQATPENCVLKISYDGVIYEPDNNGIVSLPNAQLQPLPKPELSVAGNLLTWQGAGGVTTVILPTPAPTPTPDWAGVAGSGILITPGGTQGHAPILGVKVSPAAGNQLSIQADGSLLVPPAPAPTPTPTPDWAGVAGSGILITPGGAQGHAPTLGVKVSSVVGNQLSIQPDGSLLVPTPAPTSTPDWAGVAGSGIVITPGGTQGHAPTLGVKVSPTVGNQLSIQPDGSLLVPASTPAPTPDWAGVAGSGIVITPGGSQGHTPTLGVKVSPTVGNQLSIQADGSLFVPASTPTPTPDWAGVAGAGIAITPGGTQGHAPTLGVKVSSAVGNQLSIQPDGSLLVPTPAPTPTPDWAGVAGSGIVITPGGTQGHAPTLGVKVSPTAGNQLSIQADGSLLVPASTPAPDWAGVAGSGITITPGGTQGHAPTLGVKVSSAAGNLISIQPDGSLIAKLPSGLPGSVFVMPPATEGTTPVFKKLNQWEGQIPLSGAAASPAQAIAIGTTQITAMVKQYSQGAISDDGAGTVTVPEDGVYTISADFYLRGTWAAVSSSSFAFIGAIVVIRANAALHPIGSLEHRIDEVAYPIDTAEKWLTCQGSLTLKLFAGDKIFLRAKVNTKTQTAPGYFYASAPATIPALTNAFYGKDSSAINLSVYQMAGY